MNKQSTENKQGTDCRDSDPPPAPCEPSAVGQGEDAPLREGFVTADFPIIRMGLGQVEVGDAMHNGLPALWFGRGGRGLDAPSQDLNRPAHDGETLALFTFADVRGLDAIEKTCAKVRARFFSSPLPEGAITAAGDASPSQFAVSVKKDVAHPEDLTHASSEATGPQGAVTVGEGDGTPSKSTAKRIASLKGAADPAQGDAGLRARLEELIDRWEYTCNTPAGNSYADELRAVLTETAAPPKEAGS